MRERLQKREILLQDLGKLVKLFEGLEPGRDTVAFPPITKKFYETGRLFAGRGGGSCPAGPGSLFVLDESGMGWRKRGGNGRIETTEAGITATPTIKPENVGGAIKIVTVDFGLLSGSPLAVPHEVVVVTDNAVYFHQDRFHSAEGLFRTIWSADSAKKNPLPTDVSDKMNRLLNKEYSRITFWQQLSEKHRFYFKMASFLVSEGNSVGKLIT